MQSDATVNAVQIVLQCNCKQGFQHFLDCQRQNVWKTPPAVKTQAVRHEVISS